MTTVQMVNLPQSTLVSAYAVDPIEETNIAITTAVLIPLLMHYSFLWLTNTSIGAGLISI